MGYLSPSNDGTLQNTPERTPVSSLYVLKAICAFIVVMIHTPPLETYVDSSILTPFVFIGVPIFYMITGYFLYHVDEKKVADRALKSVTKVLIAIVLLNLLYLIPLVMKSKFPFHSIQDVWDWCLTGMKIEGVFWYLNALLYALMVFFMIFRFHLGRYINIFLLLVPLGILVGRYAFLLGADRAIYSEFNAIWLALPYITLGYWLRQNENKLLRFRWEIIALISFALSALEVFVVNYYFSGFWGRYLFTPILSISLFMWCLQNKSWGANSFIAKIGRDYSGGIYYYHKIVAFSIRAFIAYLGVDAFYHDLGVLYTFILSLLISWLLVWIQDKLNVNYLR